MKNGKTWTKEEVAFMVENIKTKGVDYVAEKLGRTKKGVKYKAWNVGIRAVKNHRPDWTKQDDDYLIESFGKKTLAEMSGDLFVPKNQVTLRLKYLGLITKPTDGKPVIKVVKVSPLKRCNKPVYDTLPLNKNPFLGIL